MLSGISHHSPSLRSASLCIGFILKLISHMAAGKAKGSSRLTVLITDIPVKREHVFFLRIESKVPKKSLIFPPWHMCPSLNQSFCLGGFGCSDWLGLVMCLEPPKPYKVAGWILNSLTFYHETYLGDQNTAQDFETFRHGRWGRGSCSQRKTA